jgi:hypothetical protein
MLGAADMGVQPMRRQLTGLVSGLLVLGGLAVAGPVRADEPTPRAAAAAAVNTDGFPDPTVVEYDGGFVAVVTGPYAPRAVGPSAVGPWTWVAPALPVLPSWAVAEGIWASDLIQAGGQWVLYFSAPVRGLGVNGRCIGVATATDPTQPFVAGERPLVCPRQADVPAAPDQVGTAPASPPRRLPRGGVIDPSGFVDGAKRYLLYKTQGKPSSIRALRLTRDGTRKLAKQRSWELMRAAHTIENPELVRHQGTLVLFLSEGSYRGCGYRTTWRRSPSLKEWRTHRSGLLVPPDGPDICGPGGADVVPTSSGRRMIVLHGWTCYNAQVTCPRGRDLERSPQLGARRSIYAGWLRWRGPRPYLRFL